MTTLEVPTISSLTREYVYVPVVALRGADLAVLETLPVEFAFLTDRTAEPLEADWVDGEWDPDATKPTARCLVGTGGTKELADGTYQVWVRVTGAIERPVRNSSAGPRGVPLKVT